MKQTSWGNTNFTSSLPLFHIISFSTFHLCSYNKANNSWIYIIRCLSTIPTMHKEQWLTWHKTFAFFICAKNQLWAKTQTDRVNGCRPNLLQLGLGLGFKELVVPWRRLFLLRLRLVVGVGWSAFYFVCELLSKRSVCSRRLSREPLQQRKLYGQVLSLLQLSFCFICLSLLVFFYHIGWILFEGKFRFFSPSYFIRFAAAVLLSSSCVPCSMCPSFWFVSSLCLGTHFLLVVFFHNFLGYVLCTSLPDGNLMWLIREEEENGDANEAWESGSWGGDWDCSPHSHHSLFKEREEPRERWVAAICYIKMIPFWNTPQHWWKIHTPESLVNDSSFSCILASSEPQHVHENVVWKRMLSGWKELKLKKTDHYFNRKKTCDR